ncbi:MAG: 50S ribosomal protein L18 [Hadesarchaea archaeon]|nr:MAG: 50S ribosomal protein L18 [Hadesarchaea archaeon]
MRCFRRRREGRTDYRLRFRLLKSGKPRLVARVSLNHVRAQVVEFHPRGDRVRASAFSGELREFGWKGGTSNTPAAYLVGLMCGLRARKGGVEECVLDVGLHDPVPSSRVFAVLKGALDAGLRIPHSEEMLPGEERIRGEHIASYAQRLKEEGGYERRFSEYLKRGLPPEELPRHFEEVKKELMERLGG